MERPSPPERLAFFPGSLLGCTCRVGVHSVKLGYNMQSWGALCRAEGCWAQWRRLLETPPALGQERSYRDKQDTGSRAAARHNGQERKRVQNLLWMWSPSGASFNTVSRKTKGAEASSSCSAQCEVLESRLENWGAPVHRQRPGLERSHLPAGEGELLVGAAAWTPGTQGVA